MLLKFFYLFYYKRQPIFYHVLYFVKSSIFASTRTFLSFNTSFSLQQCPAFLLDVTNSHGKAGREEIDDFFPSQNSIRRRSLCKGYCSESIAACAGSFQRNSTPSTLTSLSPLPRRFQGNEPLQQPITRKKAFFIWVAKSNCRPFVSRALPRRFSHLPFLREFVKTFHPNVRPSLSLSIVLFNYPQKLRTR